MSKPHYDRKNSGQILVITSLVVVLLLMSTVVYVTEMQKNTPVYRSDADTGFAAIKQGATHMAISALANISNGGNSNVLTNDLARFTSTVTGSSYRALLDLEAAPSDAAPYVEGLWLDWDTLGEGVSSILLELTLNSSGNSASYYAQHTINVTSSITINSIYTPINGSQKQVIVYCTLLNEGTPAAADSLDYYYQQDTPIWIQALTPTITNYGNGIYRAVFTTQNTTQIDLPISVHCKDSRMISIWTNTTSTQS